MSETEQKPTSEPGRGPFQLPEGYDGLAEARRLLRTIRSGGLGTLARGSGHPFVSLASVATDHDGAPILLMSQLSAHTVNLDADPRVSLLLAESGKGDPLAHPRLTVLGTAVRSAAEDRAHLKTRFLARHPKAALYADFADFAFWRMRVEAGHLNGGFAKAATYTGAELLLDLADAESLLAAEQDALSHLNTDHPGTLELYAMRLLGEAGGRWLATGLDPEGLDLTAGDRTARLVFPARIRTPAALREIWRTSPGRRAVRDRKGAGASAAFPETGQRAVKPFTLRQFHDGAARLLAAGLGFGLNQLRASRRGRRRFCGGAPGVEDVSVRHVQQKPSRREIRFQGSRQRRLQPGSAASL